MQERKVTGAAAQAARRLKYWIFQRGKYCRGCCLWCRYYCTCRRDVLQETEKEKDKEQVDEKFQTG